MSWVPQRRERLLAHLSGPSLLFYGSRRTALLRGVVRCGGNFVSGIKRVQPDTSSENTSKRVKLHRRQASATQAPRTLPVSLQRKRKYGKATAGLRRRRDVQLCSHLTKAQIIAKLGQTPQYNSSSSAPSILALRLGNTVPLQSDKVPQTSYNTTQGQPKSSQ